MKIKLLFYILIILELFSCDRVDIRQKLDSAELYLQQKPDSALAILTSIKMEDLSNKGTIARYALLMSAAKDKNYIDVTDDSLINIAVNYYSERDVIKYRMMSNYYSGLIKTRNGDYSSAIISMDKAEMDANTLDDFLYSGLINRAKGDIFSRTNNSSAAQSCIREAIKMFKHLNNPDYAAYAELGLAISFLNSKDYDKAKILLDQVNSYDHEHLNKLCAIERAELLVNTGGDPFEAVQLFQSALDNDFGLNDYALYALALDRIGQRQSADIIFNKAYGLCSSQEDSATVNFIMASALSSRGEYKEAYQLTRNSSFVQDSLTRILLQQSVSNAQRDYFKSELLIEEECSRHLRIENVLIIIISLLVLIILTFASLTYRKQKEEELKEQMLQLSLWKDEYQKSEQEKASLLGSLFSEKINKIDCLSGKYIKAESEHEKYLVIKEFKDEITAMRKDTDLFLSLEQDLDHYCDGVMSKLKNQVPSIKGENLKIIALFFAGIPYSAVQLIMNKVSIESLKTARSRYRKQIKSACAPDEQFFLKLLEIKNPIKT